MNTDPRYEAVKNPEERGAAIRLIIQARKALEKRPTEDIQVKTETPQFTEKGEALVRNEFPTNKITFSFDETAKEVTVTVSPPGQTRT